MWTVYGKKKHEKQILEFKYIYKKNTYVCMCVYTIHTCHVNRYLQARTYLSKYHLVGLVRGWFQIFCSFFLFLMCSLHYIFCFFFSFCFFLFLVFLYKMLLTLLLLLLFYFVPFLYFFYLRWLQFKLPCLGRLF